MRWMDSPLALALAGTLAVHTIIAVFADAVIVTHPVRPEPPPAPRVELVKIDPPPIVRPLPPAARRLAVPDKRDVPPAQKVARRAQHVTARQEPVRAAEPTPAHAIDPAPAGGDLVVSMPDVAPAATGVDVRKGTRGDGRVGRSEQPGVGDGQGSGRGEAAPVSVATIKQRAMPRGNYDYESIKDYPAEAKQLGVEGDIRVKLTVDARGKVVAAVVLNRLGHGLDELALARARKIEFEPAKDSDDRAVASVVIWTFHMTLPKD